MDYKQYKHWHNPIRMHSNNKKLYLNCSLYTFNWMIGGANYVTANQQSYL